MKTKHIIMIFISLLIYTLILNFGIAEDYTQRNLPERAKVRIGKGTINDIDFSPDGTLIAVGSQSGVWFYNADTGAELNMFTEHTIEAEHIAFSSDGKTLAYGKYGDILLWDVSSRELIKSIKMQMQFIDSLRITDDGKSLLCENAEGLVKLLDIDSGEMRKEYYPISLRDSVGTYNKLPKLDLNAMELYLDRNYENGIIARVGADALIQLEDANTGQHLTTIKDSRNRYSKFVFSPDGAHLAMHSIKGTIRLWDVATGKHLADLTENPRAVGALKFSHDGKTLVSQTESEDLEFWDVSTKTLRTTVSSKRNRYIHVVAFSPDGKKLVGANSYGEIYIWDAYTGEELLFFTSNHTKPLSTLTFSHDSNILAISSSNNTIQLWDLFPSIQLSKRIDVKKTPIALVFSADNKTLTGTTYFSYDKRISNTYVKDSVHGVLKQWNTQTGKHLSDFPIESQHIKAVQDQGRTSFNGIMGNNVEISQNGNILATVQNSPRAIKENKFSVYLWDVTHRSFHDILKGHLKTIRTLAITPNGRMVASGSDDKTIRVWDVNTGVEMLRFKSDEMIGLSFSIDGKLLASTSNRSMIRLWDMTTVKQLPSLNGENGFAKALAFSPDSKTLASGSREGTIHLWDIATRKMMYTLKGHTSWIKILKFSPDGKTLVSGGAGGVVLLWNVQK